MASFIHVGFIITIGAVVRNFMHFMASALHLRGKIISRLFHELAWFRLEVPRLLSNSTALVSLFQFLEIFFHGISSALLWWYSWSSFICRLRGTWVNNVIPIDKAIIFHKGIALLVIPSASGFLLLIANRSFQIWFWATIHVVAHMFNWFTIWNT